MQVFQQVIQWFLDLGASVMLPIIFLAFGLILRIKPGKAFKSALTIGIGFIGLNLVIGLLTDNLGPAAKAMVDNYNLSLQTIDVGWPAASAIAYGTLLGSMAIIVGILVNVVLLLFGLTKTLNVDIWNFWHIAFTGSIVYAATASFALGIFTMITHSMLLYFMADKSANYVQEYYQLPNMSFPHGSSTPGFLLALPLNWVFDRIPGLNKINISPELVQKRFGVFGDTTVLGFFIGIIIGLLAGYDVSGTLNLGVVTGAVMLLMPRMVALLMEGLTPISEAASSWVQRRFPGKELYIGMDSALAVGQSSVLSASLLLVPIALLLAVILPGNTVLPLGDLATIPFMICLMAAVFRGDILRTVIGGALYIVTTLYVASWAAPLITDSAIASNFDLGGNPSISVLSDGGAWTTILFGGLGITWLGIGFIFVVVLFALIYQSKIKGSKKIES
ncbi:PTS galactitol transporter subunit IIC [Cerasibacillus sp. JNUCC 74]